MKSQNKISERYSFIFNRTSPTSVYDVLRLPFFFTTITGLIPLNIKSRTFEDSKLILLWSIFVNIFLVACSLLEMFKGTTTAESNLATTIVVVLSIYADPIFLIFVSVSGIFYKNKVNHNFFS